MLRKSAILATLIGALAGPAAAVEHYVIIVGDGFFPDQVYPAIGDTVRFVNQSGTSTSASATDDTWTTGVLEPDAQYVLNVTDGMAQDFVSPLSASSGTVGMIDYQNAPPLELETNSEHNHN